MTENMTPRDRDNLLRLIRAREKVAKTAAAQRSAELLDQFEQQVAAEYCIADDAVWAEAAAAVSAAVTAANIAIDRRCQELGIPEGFRPSVDMHYFSKGRNTAKEKVKELRLLAKVHLDAAEKAARTRIESHSVDLQTRILAGALESAEAVEFLASMPTVEELMPAAPTIAALEAGDRRPDR